MAASQQTNDDAQAQTVEFYLFVTSGDGLAVRTDDPDSEMHAPQDWMIEVLDRGTDYRLQDLVRGTTKDCPVGSVTVDKNWNVVSVAYNSDSIATWERYNQVNRRPRGTARTTSSTDDSAEDNSDEPTYPEDEEDTDDDEDDGEEEAQTAVYEYDAVIAAKHTTPGGRSEVEVGVHEQTVSADIACPKVAHLKDHDLFVRVCKHSGVDPAQVLRGANEGERVATFFLSENGVEGFRAAE